MRILLVHLGSPVECFMSTPLIPVLAKMGEVEVITENKNSAESFRYNPNVKKSYLINRMPDYIGSEAYDLLINLHPDFSDSLFFFNAKEKVGFNYSEDSYNTYKNLYGQEKTNKNIFQMYFNLANLKWHGEGFDFHYFPRNKTKKNRIGLAVSNRNLKDFVLDKLKLNNTKLWNIPYKKSLFKKADEINKCGCIITDDFYYANIAMAYRKQIHFLKTDSYNFKIETFGKGNIYNVPKNIVLQYE